MNLGELLLPWFRERWPSLIYDVLQSSIPPGVLLVSVPEEDWTILSIRPDMVQWRCKNTVGPHLKGVECWKNDYSLIPADPLFFEKIVLVMQKAIQNTKEAQDARKNYMQSYLNPSGMLAALTND